MVPWRERLSYAAPALALAAVGIPIFVHLPAFYTDVVGVPVGVVGGLLLAGRLFDAVSDPAVGWLSDRTRSRLGRRRPWMLAGALALGVSLYMLFTPPEGPASSARMGWWLLATFAAFTAVVVPYEALGNELSEDYDERTAVLGMRDGALLVGTLLAAAMPAILTASLGVGDGPGGQRRVFSAMALVYAPALVLLMGLATWGVRERWQAAPAPKTPFSLGQAWAGVRENRPFAILLASYTVGALGSNLPATLILYYVRYVLESDQADLFLLLYFVVGIALLPVWIMVAQRFDKKRGYIAATAINTGAFVFVFFLGPGDEAAYGALVALSGLGFGGTVAIPSAMQADVIDYDEERTGRRREGHYVGLWNLCRKLAAAGGVGLALPILEWSGYQPNVAQSEQVVWTLRVLYALVPSACSLAALLIVLRYPIDRAEHARIRAAIAARRGQG
ncbi:MAG: MFS transporter [Alphaproteobacteria bacterium]|nr:MFS transporter [Alphaproteobacteria bacterium]MCB9795118.1 MFS transporter [Alphaproteobacteria bacterium]